MLSAVKKQPDLRIRVSNQENSQRLDLYLAQHYPTMSRSQFKRLVLSNSVLVNGSSVKPRRLVRPGDIIEVWFPERKEVDQPTPEPMPLSILYEDDDILVVNKASGLVVHPGAGNPSGTLVNGLLAYCPKLALQGSPKRPGIVHRLDKDTSGALVIAKTEQAYLHLVKQFKTHQVRKEYLVLSYGAFRQPEGIIRTDLGRHPRERKKIAVVKQGREAISRWMVERSYGEVTLLRVIIETGRTHQIRVHLSYINHPVVGDSLYGGGKRRARNIQKSPLRDLLSSVKRQMLHAWKLTFTHPKNNVPLHITAPLPDDFANLLKAMDTIFRRNPFAEPLFSLAPEAS